MTDSLWESLCKNAAYKLIQAFPEIARKGSGNLGLPPLKDHPLPDVLDHDLGRKLVRCKKNKEIGTNLISLTTNRLNGFDSVVRYESVKFTQPNLQAVIPLVFQEVKLAGKWRIRQQCESSWTERTGTYVCTFSRLQVDVQMSLEDATAKVAATGVTLTDRTETWKGEPGVGLEFDNADEGEQLVITLLVKGVLNGKEQVGDLNFKSEVRKVIEGKEISNRVRILAQGFLDRVLGTAPGSILQKLERAFDTAWSSAFDANRPFYLPKLLPDPLKKPGKVFEKDLGVPVPSIPLIGWTTTGNVRFFARDASITGLHSAKGTGPLKLQHAGTRVEVTLAVPSLKIEGTWALEQNVRRVASSCAFRALTAALGKDTTADNLDPFRKAAKELTDQGGEMGKWYVDQWYANGTQIEELLENKDFKADLENYQGIRIWEKVMETIGSSAQFPRDLEDDALALLSSAINLTKNTKVGTLLRTIVKEGYPSAYIGKSYQEILVVIAKQKPPAPAALRDEPPPPLPESILEEQTWSVPGAWIVTTGISLQPVIRVDTGNDGAAPRLSVASAQVSLSDFKYDYTSTNPIAWLVIFLGNWLIPGLKDHFSPWVQDKVAEAVKGEMVIPQSVGAAIESLWETQIPV